MSSTIQSGIFCISCLDTPSGPMAAYFFFLATVRLQSSLVIGGNETFWAGIAVFKKSRIVSHVSGGTSSCFFHLGAHSSSKALMIVVTSPTTFVHLS